MRNLNNLTVPKKGGKSHSVENSGKGDPSALEWLFILEALDALKMKY